LARLNPTITDSEQPLRGVLNEFRIALREEISVAQKTSSSNAVPLTNGRRISQLGGTFQYSFTVDSILNVPGDAPGDLMVAGQRLPVVIVSTEGLTITLSVGTDLGEFVPNARLQTDLTFLLRKLTERIEALNAKENPAGDRILGFRQPSGSPEVVSVGLNPEQDAAVGSSLGRDTTFIWGPPGTGKTKTIGAIGAELVIRGSSLLLVSHTNTAVDEALLQIAQRLGEQAKNGAVLRVGVPNENKLKDNPELLLSTHVERRSADLATQVSALEDERRDKTQTCLAVQRLIAISEWLDMAVDDMQKATNDLDAVRSLEVEASTSRREFEALQTKEAKQRTLNDAASSAKGAMSKAAELRDSLEELKRAMTDLAESIVRCQKELASAKETLRYAEALEPFRQRRQRLPPLAEQSALYRYAREAADQKQAVVVQLRSALSRAEETHEKSVTASALTRLWRGLPKPETQQRTVEEMRAQLSLAEAAAHDLAQNADEAASVLHEIREIEDRIAPHSHVPWVAEQKPVVESLESRVEELRAERERVDGAVARSGARLQCLLLELEAFEDGYHASPEEVLSKCAEYFGALERAKEETRRRERFASEERGKLESLLRRWVAALREFKLLGKSTEPLISQTAEQMLSSLREGYERGKAEVVRDYVAALRLEDLVGAYDADANKCPICGGEMMPKEGAKDPFFWYCENCGYGYSIDAPPPSAGLLTCQAPECGGQVEFGEWGGKPAWRCVLNRHHHQRIRRSHLRLPRMRALIPQRELRKLDKEFGLSQLGAPAKQPTLF
jgi:AAA domain